MHPTVREQLMNAQVADMHRDAAQARLAHDARRSRRVGIPARQPSTTSTPARNILGRLLAAVTARTS